MVAATVAYVKPGNVKGYQGRHGWYSITYERYLELKAWHKKLLAGYMHLLKYWRAINKKSPNQGIVSTLFLTTPEGLLPHLEVIETRAKAAAKGSDLITDALRKRYTQQLLRSVTKMYLRFLKEYSLARRPQPENNIQPFVLRYDPGLDVIGSPVKNGAMTLYQLQLMWDILELP
jgi:hypothetical protein